MKPLKYYIAQGIADKMLDNIKYGKFTVNTLWLLHELSKQNK